MIDQKRRHAKSGRITHADAAAQFRIDGDRLITALRTGNMLDQVDRKRARQPYRYNSA